MTRAMTSRIRKRFGLLACQRRFAVLLGAFALLVLASGCRGGEPRNEQAEQSGEGKRPAQTKPPAGDGEQRVTTQPGPPERQRKARELVWVALENADQVALVDLAKGKVLARHDAAGGPHNVTVARDGTVAATLYGSDRLVLARRRKARFVDLGGAPHDVKAAGHLFVVANEAARRLDLVRGGEDTASVDLKAEPHDLAITPGGNRAWVTLNGTDELAVVDLRARRVVRYVGTGQRPHDILFAPDGRLWVTDWAGPVHVFDRRGRLHGEVQLAEESHHLAFTPDGRQAWITDHGAERVFIVDARRLRLVDSIPVPGAPHHVAVTPDGELAAVADHESGTLVVYDVKRHAHVRTVRVGAGPHGVWATPAEPSP
jgi:DNA-binding beta-propeller fold protein YncE